MVGYPVALEPIRDSAKQFSNSQLYSVFRKLPNSSEPEQQRVTVSGQPPRRNREGMGGDDNSELLTGLLSSQVPGGSQGVSLRLTVAAVQAFAYMAPLDTRKAVRASWQNHSPTSTIVNLCRKYCKASFPS